MTYDAERAALKDLGAHHVATMPGFVEHLACFNDRLWAAVRMERKWWQFWMPRKFTKWIDATHYLDA